jgi:hypothetical protein
MRRGATCQRTAVDHLDHVDADLRGALGVAHVNRGWPWSSQYIATVSPKKRLIVGTPPMVADTPVGQANRR